MSNKQVSRLKNIHISVNDGNENGIPTGCFTFVVVLCFIGSKRLFIQLSRGTLQSTQGQKEGNKLADIKTGFSKKFCRKK